MTLIVRELVAANDGGNPAAAKIRCFQNPPHPPLGFTALLGGGWKFTQHSG
ncbi:MAG: hypothetical protein ACODAD_12620 [Planctomycetota bacterium]